MFRQTRQQGVDSRAETATPLAVDEADGQDAPGPAFLKPSRQKIREIAGAVSVQVQVAGDLYPDWAVRRPGRFQPGIHQAISAAMALEGSTPVRR